MDKVLKPFLSKYNYSIEDINCDLPDDQRLELINRLSFTAMKDGRVIKIKNTVPKFFLTNYQNSCAPDSILFILFFCRGSYFLDRMFKSPMPKFEKELKFRKQIQPEIAKLYGNMSLWNNHIWFQDILVKYLEKDLDCDDVKSGTQIWGLLASAFPGLEYPAIIDGQKMMATYLEPYVELENYPSHAIFGDDDVPQDRKLNKTMENLEAVLFFMDGFHYTSAVKANDRWYYYNDLAPSVVILANPEKFIFNESVNKKIAMLFYGE